MVSPKKVHLIVKRNTLAVACGITRPTRRTTDPAEVTCESCKRTLAMADAEARAVILRRR